VKLGGRRRAQGARPTKAARAHGTGRSPDAALGRETRGLVGPAKDGRRGPAGKQGQDGRRLPSLPSLGGRRGGRRAGSRRSALGRLFMPARAAGLLGMIVSGFLLTFVTGPSAFALSRTELPSLEWTADADLHAALAVPEGANVFRLDTAPIEAALEALPGVASADVRVALPDAAVVVAIEEREAILAWEAGDTRFLADREGVVFATIALDEALPAGVAVVEDRRAGAAGNLAIGSRLDPVDLDVATRLGSLTPADVGSAASRLRVRVTDPDGFVIFVDKGWTAVFGFYSPATRPTGMIPGQVRLLRSYLDGREAATARVVLASETDGTYLPKPTAKPAKP
jgi:hypothetical protein